MTNLKLEHTEGTSQFCVYVIGFLVEVIRKLIPEGQGISMPEREEKMQTRDEEKHLWN